LGNWDFDDDEVFFFIAAAIAAFAGFIRWYWRLLRLGRFGRRGPQRAILGLTPILPLIAVLYVLTHWADPKYVIDHFDFQALFFTGAVAWLWIAGFIAPVLGVTIRDDALERSNAPAALAIAGFVTGCGVIYAGSNIGAGPTIWTTIAPATIGSIALLLLGFFVEVLGRPSEFIAIDHDLATGLRHCAFFLGAGLIIARAAAGDFTTWHATFNGLMRLSAPAIVLAVIAIALHVAFHPTPTRPTPSIFACGVVPGIVLIGLALAYVLWLGPAEIGKHIITFEEYMKTR
jgi:uncharacterized membrane protein YjfL (UPF0719 family)